MLSSVARPVQHEQEGHDPNKHALASHFVGSNRMRLHLQEGQIGIFWEGFSQKQEREEMPWYQGYGQGAQESLLWEALQPVQEAWGTYTTHNTRDCCRFEMDGKEKSNFRATKKGGKKGNPVNHNFAQLTEKIEKLEKVLKKSGKKGKKHHYEDSDSNSE